MKKLVVYSIIGLMLAGCADRELTTENINDVPAESSFLSVSIVASGTTGTRAATEPDEEGNYENDRGTYRDGTAAENYVNEVLFLFFDEDGEPANAFKDADADYSYRTWYLWKVNEDDEDNEDNKDVNENPVPDHNETVEKILNKTIHISVPHNHAKPTQLFAVVNPTAKHKAILINKSLSELSEIVEDYEFDEYDNNAKLSDYGKFVMTNSVYYETNNGAKNIIYTTNIENKYYDDENEAKDNPIYVYVERVLARIDLKININNSKDNENRRTGKDENGNEFYYYYTGTTLLLEGEDKKYETPEDIYVRFLGWNVFDTPTKSRLIKSIGDASWDNDSFFGNGLPWNAVDFHRSFWAINPAENLFDYRTGPFDEKADLETETGNKDTEFENWYANNNDVPAPGDKTDYVTAYFQENAAPNETWNDAPEKPSKVILAAQLVDKDGKPRALANWAGKYYYSWDGLATYFCNSLLDLYYVESTTTDSNNPNREIVVLHKIEPKHLYYQSDNDSYKVSVILSEEGKKVTWYKGADINTGADFDTSKALSEEEVGKYILTETGKNTVMVWKNGYTYFYFTIRHLGSGEQNPAYYGVVRNHIYDATVNSVTGLGTPVADPNSKITVTPPEEDTGILAAQVRILSWRLVTQSYDLNW